MFKFKLPFYTDAESKQNKATKKKKTDWEVKNSIILGSYIFINYQQGIQKKDDHKNHKS